MDLIQYAKTLLQETAEKMASYRLGQIVLRQTDRVLWVIEKSARWSVPPALETDDRPANQPELVRPLPWVFFLALLIVLRVGRESISLINLLVGRPPLRPAEIVSYIQSKRRYIRALKYQGSRNLRSRQSRGSTNRLLSKIYSLFEFTMCFRRPGYAGNNNSVAASNNEEILVIKKSSKRKNEVANATDENAMERLIEKMVDMYGESSDDSEYTLTNATSIKSDTSLTSGDSDTERNSTDKTISEQNNDKTLTEPEPNIVSSTPIKSRTPTPTNERTGEELFLNGPQELRAQYSPKEASNTMILTERQDIEDATPKKTSKMVNGKGIQHTPKTKEENVERTAEVPVLKISESQDTPDSLTHKEGNGVSEQNKQ